MKKILFCTDLSQSCQNLCAYVSEWVGGTDIKVDIIHSYDPDLVNISSADMTEFSEFHAERKKEMVSKMKSFLSELPEQNRGKYHLEEDVNRALAIRQMALITKADLIVTGLRDRYTLMDKLIGSTVAKMVGDVNPPLLVVPYDRKYTPIKKVLFTTQSTSKDELSVREEDAITWIYDHFNKDAVPAIHILHVVKEKVQTIVDEHSIMPLKFTSTYSTDVVMGIIDHLESSPVDIVVVHHEEKNLWERIHKSSVAKNLLYKAKMPILFI